MRRWWRTLGTQEQIALIGVLVALLGVVPTYLVFFQSGKQESGSIPAPTTLGSNAPPSSTESTATSTQTAEPTTSGWSSPTTRPSGRPTYELRLADRVYVDLDHAVVEAEGGSQFELLIDSGRFFHGPDHETFASKFAIIKDDQQRSANTCRRATKVIPDVLFYSEVRDNESVCVRTSEGRWAIMKLTNFEGNLFVYEEYDFDVYLF
jgi:hypothetical protein